MQIMRSHREIVHGNEFKNDMSLTVFIGLFNAAHYLSAIERQLDRQLTNQFQILAVDNCSEDETWKNLQLWLEKYRNRIILVRNPTNLGGAGSIELNLDLVSTPWITFMHQDDKYRDHHLSLLLNQLTNCPKEILAISCQMGSIDEAGRLMGTPPRAQLHMSENDRFRSFIINIKTHSVPWPATAFRTDVYRAHASPWHSTSFTDTEITLKLLLRGKVRNLYSETMKYRENPKSESHTVGAHEAAVGASIGLIRIFASDNFVNFSRELPNELRSDFRINLIEAVQQRVNLAPYLEFVLLVLEESLSYAWNYSEENSLKFIGKIYKNLQSSFTPELMGRIEKFLRQNSNISQDMYNHAPIKTEDVNDGTTSIPIHRQFYYRFGWLIPYWLRKRIFKILTMKKFK